MPFGSGTITNAAPWATLSTTIQALFNQVGSRNWTFVEQIPAGTGANQSGSSSFKVDVYKCAGSGTDANDLATDFYVAFRIPVPDGAVSSQVHVYENYDSSTKKFSRPAASSSATAPTGSGYWRTDSLATESAATGAQGTFTQSLNTTGFTYFCRVYKNNLQVSVRVGSTDSWCFFGFGDTFIPSSLVTDVFLFLMGTSLGASAAVTREPPLSDATLSKWNYSLQQWTPVQGVNLTNANDFWQANKVITPRMLVTRSLTAAETSTGHIIGTMRGLAKDILLLGSGGTVNVGDTLVISGVTYYVFALSLLTAKDSSNNSITSHLILPQN